MRKIVLLFFIVTMVITICDVIAVKKIIPDEAIRLRVIPNSNSLRDQEIKLKVKEALQENVYYLLKDTKGIDEARIKINNNLVGINNVVNNVINNENYEYGYTLDFSYHYFPKKEYKGLVYDEGYYESLLVTLGKGKGDNWWCVLFPPLCLLEAEEADEVEYKFFIKELINRYL